MFSWIKSLLIVALMLPTCLIAQDIDTVYYGETMDDKTTLTSKENASQYVIHRLDSTGTGIAETYYITGEFGATSQMRYGLTHGETLWHYRNGNKHSQANYHNGMFHGTVTLWYESGEKQIEVEYEKGERHGSAIWWYQSGQKKSKGNYQNDLAHGLFTDWDEEGHLYSKIQFKDNTQHGKAEWWYPSGQKSEEGEYVNGKAEGVFLRWHTNGQLKSRIEWKDGESTDNSEWWDSLGNKLYTISNPADLPLWRDAEDIEETLSSLIEYINTQITLPLKVSETTSFAHAEAILTISNGGKVSDVQFFYPGDSYYAYFLENTLREILIELDDWIPGVYEGESVYSRISLDIGIEIEE